MSLKKAVLSFGRLIECVKLSFETIASFSDKYSRKVKPFDTFKKRSDPFSVFTPITDIPPYLVKCFFP